MKISSVSKKVLASALSAAMVVAFAPTVAFGQVAPEQTVTVKFDVTGLTQGEGSAPITDQTVAAKAGEAGKVVLTLESTPAGYKYASGAAIDGWYFDANNDGVKGETEATLVGKTVTIPVTTDLADNTLTLKPYINDAFAVAGAPTAGSAAIQKANAGSKFFTMTIGEPAVAGDSVEGLFVEQANGTHVDAHGTAQAGVKYCAKDADTFSPAALTAATNVTTFYEITENTNTTGGYINAQTDWYVAVEGGYQQCVAGTRIAKDKKYYTFAQTGDEWAQDGKTYYSISGAIAAAEAVTTQQAAAVIPADTYYVNGVVTSDTFAKEGTEYTTKNEATYTEVTNLKRDVAAKGASTYSATLAKDGAVISSQNVAVSAIDGVSNKIAFTFADSQTIKAADKEKGAVSTADYGKGAYTVTVKDLLSGKSVVKSFTIVEMTLNGVYEDGGKKHVGQKVLAYKGQKVLDAINSAAQNVDGYRLDTVAEKTLADGSTVNGTANKWTSNGAAVTGDTDVADGMVLEPVYTDTVLTTLDWDAVAKKFSTTTVNGTKAGATYKATITGPGVEKKDVTVDGSGTTDLFAFGGDTTAAAGIYTVVINMVETIGGSEVVTKVAEDTLTLAAVTLDLGDKAKFNGTAPQPVILEEGDQLSAAAAGFNFAASATYVDKTVTFIGWSLDGTNLLKTTDKVGTQTAYTLKAVYAETSVAAPTWTWADGTLTLSADLAAGYEIRYSITGAVTVADTKYTAPIKLSANNAATVTVSFRTVKTGTAAAAGKADSQAVTIVSSNGKAIDNNLVNALAVQTAGSTAAAPKYYSTELKAATDAAAAAIKAKGYATAEEWTKFVVEQEAGVLKAVADLDSASVDAYAAGVKQADGTVKKTTEAAAAEAKSAIVTVLADFDKTYDGDKATVASKNYANKGAYVGAIKEAAKKAIDAAATYAKADVDAAAAVTAQLQAAKTAAEAEAALAAYKALNATQKELVSAADVAAAEAIVAKAAEAEAAAKLVKAQDKAAAASGKAKVKGATYSIKAKGSKTIKLAKSASGAKTTLIQKSGTKYAKVSGTTIKLKAAAKAGKTYTIKVKVKSGTYTTATTSFKVKVK